MSDTPIYDAVVAEQDWSPDHLPPPRTLAMLLSKHHSEILHPFLPDRDVPAAGESILEGDLGCAGCGTTTQTLTLIGDWYWCPGCGPLESDER